MSKLVSAEVRGRHRGLLIIDPTSMATGCSQAANMLLDTLGAERAVFLAIDILQALDKSGWQLNELDLKALSKIVDNLERKGANYYPF